MPGPGRPIASEEFSDEPFPGRPPEPDPTFDQGVGLGELGGEEMSGFEVVEGGGAPAETGSGLGGMDGFGEAFIGFVRHFQVGVQQDGIAEAVMEPEMGEADG